MKPALEQLVREVIDVTGADKPNLLHDDAPTLSDAALNANAGEFYLVGLIGGKDVGKSALINALVGKTITEVTSYGAGTEIAIAYAHASLEPQLRKLLDREVPGQYRMVLHNFDSLRGQVLLDLPDIDSRYASHLAVTQAMLRHMLFPVWVSSVEKYADQQPQMMLARVAEGNAPGNFIFCLNKVDQIKGVPVEAIANVPSSHQPEEHDADHDAHTPWARDLDEEAARMAQQKLQVKEAITSILEPKVAGEFASPLEEIRADYSARIARTLKLPAQPRVYLLSTRKPEAFELPALRRLLSREKSAQVVRDSKQLATDRQDRALVDWLDDQELPRRTERLGRLKQDAQELIADRLAGPVLERIVPRLLDDPSTRFAMADEILNDRVARWPIVNLIHTLLQPLFMLVRSSISRGSAPMQGPEAMVDVVMRESGESVSKRVQSVFAQLRQSQPALAPLYEQNKLWEDMPADLAERNLSQSLAQTVSRQREHAKQSLSRSDTRGAAPIRWLLTIGALVWFPFLQPILAALLPAEGASFWSIHFAQVGRLIVMVLGVDYLLKSAGFLIIYYAALWLALRWNTQRRVGRLMSRWRAADFPEPALSLTTQTLRWMDGLTAPITAAHDRLVALRDRMVTLRGAPGAKTEIQKQTPELVEA